MSMTKGMPTTLKDCKGLQLLRWRGGWGKLLVEWRGKLFWVPLAVIKEESSGWNENSEGDLVVEEWFARQQGMIG